MNSTYLAGVSIGLCTLMATGCDTLNQITADFTTSKTSTIVIQGAQVSQELPDDIDFAGFDGFDLKTNEEFENEDLDPNDIQSVVVQSVTVRTIDPDGAVLDFFDTMNFSLSAAGLDEVEIGSLDPVPDGETEVELDTDQPDITEYVLGNAMSINVLATGVPPDENTEIETDVQFLVTFKVANALGG